MPHQSDAECLALPDCHHSNLIELILCNLKASMAAWLSGRITTYLDSDSFYQRFNWTHLTVAWISFWKILYSENLFAGLVSNHWTKYSNPSTSSSSWPDLVHTKSLAKCWPQHVNDQFSERTFSHITDFGRREWPFLVFVFPQLRCNSLVQRFGLPLMILSHIALASWQACKWSSDLPGCRLSVPY